MTTLREDQIERYARHILLPGVGGVGQQRLFDATVVLDGLGPSGAWAAHYLVMAGVGRLILRDPRGIPGEGLPPILPHDEVSRDGPRSRGQVAREALSRFNPDVVFEVGQGEEAVEGDESRISIERGSGKGGEPILWLRTVGASSFVGWVGRGKPPCDECLGEQAPPLPEAAALTGSLAANAVLGSLLFGPPAEEGIFRWCDGEPVPACHHR